MRIAWEEPFGPVLPILRVNNVDEAIQHCNQNTLALQGSVFTQNVNQAITISDALQTGTVQVQYASMQLPCTLSGLGQACVAPRLGYVYDTFWFTANS